MVSIEWLFKPALGGLLIGTAALLLYATLGRIAGISGIAYGAVWGGQGQRSWRWVFVLGLVVGGWLALRMGIALAAMPLPGGRNPLALVLVAGVLVGVGTQLGNGCTSGHGICGLARLSRRSLFAVVTFMGFGFLAASVLRPMWF